MPTSIGEATSGYRLLCLSLQPLMIADLTLFPFQSPATSNERLQSLETVHAFRALMEYLKHDTFDAVMGLEIGWFTIPTQRSPLTITAGGANGLEPFLVGSSRFFDRAVIDADCK